MATSSPSSFSFDQRQSLLTSLQARFEQHPARHPKLDWHNVQARLEVLPDKLWSLYQMEHTDGEPDVVGVDANTGEFLFVDCSPESPQSRRSLCYDRAALDARKTAKPINSAVDLAAEMGITLLSEAQNHDLQALGPFDQKTSSWLLTPPYIREKGGAIFGDYRFGRVFVYHNGAQSYYAARGFRGILRV